MSDLGIVSSSLYSTTPSEKRPKMRQKQAHPKKRPKSPKHYSYEALCNAYKQVKEKKLSARKASILFNIPRTTLRDRLSGKIHIDTVTTKLPLIGQLEESQLVDHIKKMAEFGYGYTRQEVVNLATDLAIQLGKRTKDQPLSLRWLDGFLKRWPELRVLKPRGLEYCRAKCTSEETVTAYFDNLEKCLRKHGLTDKPHLIFNLDEKGVTTEHKPPFIVGKSSACLQAVTSGRGKTVTILGCISASGMAIPPFFVFPGKRMNSALLDGKSPGADGTVSESGWSNHAVFRQYIQEHFVKYIPGREEQNVILILDGHKSHVSVGLCEWAKENGIIFFFLPPHTSHILQPLDVACYGPFERMFNSECHKLMRQTESVLTRFNICEVACRVYSKALSSENAQSAFRRSGIYPLDITAIPPDSMIPAEVYNVEKNQDVNQNSTEVILNVDETQDDISLLFSTKEAKLKKIKGENVTKQRKTMSKLIAGKEVSDDIIEKMKEHEMNMKPAPKAKLCGSKNIKGLQEKKKQHNNNCPIPVPKPGPSHIYISEDNSDITDSDSDEEAALCCVCNKFQPDELKNCASLVFVKWAQCDGKKENGFPCLHWVHLSYCSSVRVIRRGDKFLCPHCSL